MTGGTVTVVEMNRNQRPPPTEYPAQDGLYPGGLRDREAARGRGTSPGKAECAQRDHCCRGGVERAGNVPVHRQDPLPCGPGPDGAGPA